MIRRGAIFVIAGVVAAALASDPPGGQDHPRQSAQRAPAQESQPVGATLSEEEHAARSAAGLALAKLDLVLARKALRNGDFSTAARKALRAQMLLKRQPLQVEVDEYDLQAAGILARAALPGGDVAALRRDVDVDGPLVVEDDELLDRQVQAASTIARQYDGSERPDIDTSSEQRALRERTIRRQMPGRYGYRPGAAIVDVDSIRDRDRQRLAYQGALAEAYKEDEVRLVVGAEEARVVPDGDISFPNDYPERMKRRAKYAGGQIARSSSWYDDEGNEWYVAIYDIHDLIYVPPDFTLGGTFGVFDPWVAAMDRDALRHRSFIFGGGAYDLAYGSPLLAYFGGINPWIARGGTYDLDRQREIVRMISAFTDTPLVEPALPPAPVPDQWSEEAPGNAAEQPKKPLPPDHTGRR